MPEIRVCLLEKDTSLNYRDSFQLICSGTRCWKYRITLVIQLGSFVRSWAATES